MITFIHDGQGVDLTTFPGNSVKLGAESTPTVYSLLIVSPKLKVTNTQCTEAVPPPVWRKLYNLSTLTPPWLIWLLPTRGVIYLVVWLNYSCQRLSLQSRVNEISCWEELMCERWHFPTYLPERFSGCNKRTRSWVRYLPHALCRSPGSFSLPGSFLLAARLTGPWQHFIRREVLGALEERKTFFFHGRTLCRRWGLTCGDIN